MNKFFIGLVLGIVIAGGLAIYLNNSPTQFTIRGVNHGSATNSSGAPVLLSPGVKLNNAVSQATSSNQLTSDIDDISINNESAQAPSPKTAPKYDFYNILQGKNDNAKHVASSIPTASELLFVQAGSFNVESAANAMQAQLALLGISSTIRSQIQGDVVNNRVLIGPLATESQVSEVINKLASEQISAVLVKLTN